MSKPRALRYPVVIFDLDGTLADTAQGILQTHRHTLSAIGLPPPTPEQLSGVIGGALDEIYRTRFHVPEADLPRVLDIYRAYYAVHGVAQAPLYQGILPLLKGLKERGAFLGVATLKREDLAKTILTDTGAADYLDLIRGVDAADTLKKHDLALACVEAAGAGVSGAVLVGDSRFDAEGAGKAGIAFWGVTYGYGFRTEAEALAHGCAVGASRSVQALGEGLLEG